MYEFYSINLKSNNTYFNEHSDYSWANMNVMVCNIYFIINLKCITLKLKTAQVHIEYILASYVARSYYLACSICF